MTQDLLESLDQGVATLTLNRPEALNALSRPMVAALSEALPRLALDPAVRAVVLTGAGRAFCAGGDVKVFAQSDGRGSGSGMGFDQRVADLRMRMEVVRWLHEMPKPTLAVLPGAAAGAGLSLALACDLRIATLDAKLSTAFARIGLSGDFGGSYFLTHCVGAALARELYFSGRVVLGDEAQRLGLVHRTVPSDDLVRASREWAQELAAMPTIALGYMKKNLNLAMHASLSDVLDSEAMHMVRTFETQDHRQAAQAFVDKRPPQFSGT